MCDIPRRGRDPEVESVSETLQSIRALQLREWCGGDALMNTRTGGRGGGAGGAGGGTKRRRG